MAGIGAVFTGILMVASSAIFFMAFYLSRYKWEGVLSETSLGMATLFWVLAGTFTFLTGIRLLFGFFGAFGIDRTLFILSTVPGSVLAAPVFGMSNYIVTGNERQMKIATGSIALFAFTVLLISMASGVTGPEIGFWGTNYQFVNDLATLVILIGTFVPGLMATTVLFLYSYLSPSGEVSRGVLYAALSIFIMLLSIILVGLVGQDDIFLATVFRLMIVLSSVLGFLAYYSVAGADGE